MDIDMDFNCTTMSCGANIVDPNESFCLDLPTSGSDCPLETHDPLNISNTSIPSPSELPPETMEFCSGISLQQFLPGNACAEIITSDTVVPIQNDSNVATVVDTESDDGSSPDSNKADSDEFELDDKLHILPSANAITVNSNIDRKMNGEDDMDAIEVVEISDSDSDPEYISTSHIEAETNIHDAIEDVSFVANVSGSETDDSLASSPDEMHNSSAQIEQNNEEWDEMVRQCDLQLGSQRIVDEDSDSDENGEYGIYNDDGSKPLTHKPISIMNASDQIQCSRPPISSQLIGIEMDAIALEISLSEHELLKSPPHPIDDSAKSFVPTSPTRHPISSQLIGIEMDAIALEMSLSEQDLLKSPAVPNEETTNSTYQPTDADFNEGFEQTVRARIHIPHTIHRTRSRKLYNDPMPLMIDDVLQLLRKPLDPGRSLTMFGFRFNQIAIYGRCAPLPYSSGGKPNTKLRRLYEVDDGTASVSVWFNHFSDQRTGLLKEVQQCQQHLTSLRSKIDKSFHADLRRVMLNIRSNHRLPIEREFRLGSNVLVFGRPYWSSFRNEVQVSAYEMHDDDRISRGLELAFKTNLANMYETRYELDDVGDM